MQAKDHIVILWGHQPYQCSNLTMIDNRMREKTQSNLLCHALSRGIDARSIRIASFSSACLNDQCCNDCCNCCKFLSIGYQFISVKVFCLFSWGKYLLYVYPVSLLTHFKNYRSCCAWRMKCSNVTKLKMLFSSIFGCPRIFFKSNYFQIG